MALEQRGVEASLRMPRKPEPQRALGHVIRARREALGLSQEEVALATGTDQARVSRIENAGDNPSYGMVERIAQALDLELWELAKIALELQAQEQAAAEDASARRR